GKVLRLALRAPTQLRTELEIPAQQNGWQEQSQLETILLRRGKQTERTVEMKLITVRTGRLGATDQAVEFHQPEKLSVALWRFASNRHVNAGRTQQHRLGKGDIIALEQALRRDILEADQTLLAFEIGEQTLINGVRRQSQRVGNV